MATPAQIRRERKISLREVKKLLKVTDTRLEQTERIINRVLKVRKRFPDQNDAEQIIQGLTDIDKSLDVVVKSAMTFANMVQSF